MIEAITAIISLIGLLLGHYLGYRQGARREVTRYALRMEEADAALAAGDAAAISAIFERMRRERAGGGDPGGQGS